MAQKTNSSEGTTPVVSDEEITPNSLLWKAAIDGKIEEVDKALSLGADIDYIDDDDNGETPLIIASYSEYANLVKHLLLKGANPTIASKTGLTALGYARSYKLNDIIEILESYKNFHQPLAREDHSTAIVGNYLYMWVGNQDGISGEHNSEAKKAITSCIERFNLQTRQWEQRTTTGNPPLGVYRYATAVIGNEIFYFGGHCNHNRCFHNSLYSLNVSSLQWRELFSTHTDCGPHPSMKDCCGMIPIIIDGDYYLAIVGGWGSSSSQPGAQYIKGFNNEVHYIELATGQWISPQINGDRPPPCSSFTLTSITDDTAILFGGWISDAEAVDHVYTAKFTKESITWKQLSEPPIDQPVNWPLRRSSHASVLINTPIGPHLFVLGGFVHDCWVLDIDGEAWKSVTLSRTVTNRERHSLSVWTVTPTTVWIIEFGGRRDREVVSETAVIEFAYNESEEWSISTVPLDQYTQILRKRRRESQTCKSSHDHLKKRKMEQIKKLDQQLQYKLTLSTLMEVFCEEPGIQSDWQRIAMSLGITYKNLPDARGDHKVALCNVLEYWQVNPSDDKPFVWSTIIKAIEGSIVDNSAKAKRLKEAMIAEEKN